jgi:hypothetical protein
MDQRIKKEAREEREKWEPLTVANAPLSSRWVSAGRRRDRNGRANDRGQRRRHVISCKRVTVGTDFRRAAAYGTLAALVTGARVLVPLMRGARAMMFLSCA